MIYFYFQHTKCKTSPIVRSFFVYCCKGITSVKHMIMCGFLAQLYVRIQRWHRCFYFSIHKIFSLKLGYHKICIVHWLTHELHIAYIELFSMKKANVFMSKQKNENIKWISSLFEFDISICWKRITKRIERYLTVMGMR